ncbi:MAG: tetratricopeptide repeat protein, partial [Nitrospinota bacterium]|nr:tetratricopeptide repeat protein [Nitrospinota bacterium]
MTKRVLIWVFVLVAVFVLGRPSPSLAAQRRIAVLDFRNTSRHQGLIWLSQAVPETLVTKLAGVSSIHVIERGQLEKIIKEQRLGLMDLFDPSKAAKIGRLAGAQVVVIGGYVVFGKGLMFNLRFVDAETGIVLHTAQVRGGTSDEDALFGTLTRLADAAVESLGKKVVIRGGEKRVVKAPPVTLTPRERKRLAAPPAKSLTAYELYGKGLEAYKKNHWREADALYARALQRDPALADAAGWRARVLGDLGRYAEALDLNARTLTLYRKKKDDENTAAVLNNIGEIHRKQGRYEEALRRYEESIDIERRLGNQAGIATTLNNMAVLRYNQGKYAEALGLFCRTLIIMRRI